VAQALAETVQHGIDWRGQRRDIFLPRLAIDAVTVAAIDGVEPPPRDPLDLAFVTPVNGEGDDPLERPATLIARLARRVEGLARWQDAAIAVDWHELARHWEEMSYDLGALRRGTARRHSGRAGRDFNAAVIAGVLRITEIPPELRALLAIGATAHIGKGASEGFGRYLLA
jgi:hypothetical protein